jgi:hypothetical protein
MAETQPYLFPEMQKDTERVIYESPDGGKTIYKRKADSSDRTKIEWCSYKDSSGYYKYA